MLKISPDCFVQGLPRESFFTTKADCILKTPHERVVPEVETLSLCGQRDHTLSQAPDPSSEALTLRDVL